MTVYKKYIEDYSQTLKITVHYAMGGMNYFTGGGERRGYYLSVSPVTVSKGDGYTSESYTAFTGTKMLLLEVKRRSKAAEQKAIGLMDAQLEKLINHVVVSNNLTKVKKEPETSNPVL